MDKSMDIHGYPWTYPSTKTMDMDLGGLIHLKKRWIKVHMDLSMTPWTWIEQTSRF